MAQYWLDLFTGTTWAEFLAGGAEVSGFRDGRRNAVQRFREGDYLLCYLTGVSRFVGVLEVTSRAYRDESPIWSREAFPWRVKVRPVVTLTPETAVPVQELSGILSAFQNLSNPRAWTGHFRGSPARWSTTDGDAVVQALREAESNPVVRPTDAAKLARVPRPVKSRVGPVVIPVPEPGDEPSATASAPADGPEVSEHTEIQWLLLKLGSDMGLDIWAATDDRNKSYHGARFAELRGMRSELPRHLGDRGDLQNV